MRLFLLCNSHRGNLPMYVEAATLQDQDVLEGSEGQIRYLVQPGKRFKFSSMDLGLWDSCSRRQAELGRGCWFSCGFVTCYKLTHSQHGLTS